MDVFGISNQDRENAFSILTNKAGAFCLHNASQTPQLHAVFMNGAFSA